MPAWASESESSAAGVACCSKAGGRKRATPPIAAAIPKTQIKIVELEKFGEDEDEDEDDEDEEDKDVIAAVENPLCRRVLYTCPALSTFLIHDN